MNATVHYRITIKGTVQGVGFRPFVYQLAKKWGIKGTVLNSGQGVVIEAEAEEYNMERFIGMLKDRPPALSRVEYFERVALPVEGYHSFTILLSESSKRKGVLIPADVATCEDCMRDIRSPEDRHYLYPFTNCTNCGPRFSIIKDVPYDRPNTSMSTFKMCDNCSKEYGNPEDRRFHAQPVACPDCGPWITLADREGRVVAERKEWLELCWHFLEQGKILALKSIGGFHLVCNAKDGEAVRTLRARKGREAKPFAVMCRDLSSTGRYCFIGETEEMHLVSREAPIVILEKRKDYSLPGGLAPNITSLGVMLPYTPLHILLMNGPFDVLVMTSGNYTGLPLVKENETALKQLGEIADYFIFHNREIVNRCDDSVIRVTGDEMHFFRRSRGFVPDPIQVTREDAAPVILAVGAEMKNNFCLLKKNQAFVSQYIGEIDSVEAEENLRESLFNFQGLIDAMPEIIAFDAHPNYVSARIAREMEAKHHIPVYHHHAHLAGCMVDNGLDNEPVIGVILDGTGYGPDGNLWGFEVLTGDYTDFHRHYHLDYIPLPGGEIAIREVWRTACSFLITLLGEEGKTFASMLFPEKDCGTIERMIRTGFNAPLACGCGRLFDAVSAMAGICLVSTYEGQAAIELGEEALKSDDCYVGNIYPYSIENGIIRVDGIIRDVARERIAGVSKVLISNRFHHTIRAIVSDTVDRVSGETGITKVVLSGGTWQNRILFRAAKDRLTENGYTVMYHRHVPANDGGIALGQAMIANRRWSNGCV